MIYSLYYGCYSFDDERTHRRREVNQSLSLLISVDIAIDWPFVTFRLTMSKSQLLSRSSMGDNVELVDGDLDDDTDDGAEQLMLAIGPYLFWISFAVNTSSSSSWSTSESELFDAEAAGRGSNLPAARKFCSSSSNWPMKLRLGEMIGRANLTIL